MAILKLFLFLLFVIYLFGAIAAVFTFIIDVIKWHSREEHAKVIPSAQINESEVTPFERRGDLGSGSSGSGSSGASDDNSHGSSGSSELDNNNDGYF